MSGFLTGFEVRPATAGDLDRIAELDRLAFAGAGMGHYGRSHVRCWMEINPEGLLVAWRGDMAVACCYSQYVDFSLADIPRLTTDAAFTDAAFTRKTHRPGGNAIHVVTVSSIVPGGRRALFDALARQLVAQSREFLILFSRVAGFDGYCRMLAGRGVDVDSLDAKQMARWYVLQCVAQHGGQVWSGVSRESLALPPPSAPDPVLNKYLKDPGARVVAVLEEWIEDPASRNCSALVAIANPQRVAPGAGLDRWDIMAR
jgi:hypothetical protein